jgi:hypothetical protein
MTLGYLRNPKYKSIQAINVIADAGSQGPERIHAKRKCSRKGAKKPAGYGR